MNYAINSIFFIVLYIFLYFYFIAIIIDLIIMNLSDLSIDFIIKSLSLL